MAVAIQDPLDLGGESWGQDLPVQRLLDEDARLTLLNTLEHGLMAGGGFRAVLARPEGLNT